jgi:hypothetical protein
MQLGPELEALCDDAHMTTEPLLPPPPPPPAIPSHIMSASVAELVGQLSGAAPPQSVPDVAMTGGGGSGGGGNGGAGGGGGGGGAGGGMPYNNYDPTILAGFGPEQLQQILQQAQALQNPSANPSSNSSMFPPSSAAAGVNPPAHASAEQHGWGSNGYSPYENAEDARWAEDGWRGGSGGGGGGPGRGRGRGRGRGGFGRGNRRRPCVFHQEGR